MRAQVAVEQDVRVNAADAEIVEVEAEQDWSSKRSSELRAQSGAWSLAGPEIGP